MIFTLLLSVVLTVPADHQWLKLNRDQVGFYRVNYDTDDWTRLSDALLSNASQFSISDRGHLLNDAFSLAAASTIKYDVALNLTKYLNSEAEFVPWSAALSGLGGLRNNLYSSKSYSLFLVSSNKNKHQIRYFIEISVSSIDLSEIRPATNRADLQERRMDIRR